MDKLIRKLDKACQVLLFLPYQPVMVWFCSGTGASFQQTLNQYYLAEIKFGQVVLASIHPLLNLRQTAAARVVQRKHGSKGAPRTFLELHDRKDGSLLQEADASVNI